MVVDPLAWEDPFAGLDLYADTAIGDVRDPYPEYARARRETPIAEMQYYGITSLGVHRYDDVAAILEDNETFSSSIYEGTLGIVFGPTILQMDGRDHLEHRGLIAHAFRRKVLRDWEQTTIVPIAEALVDRFAGRGRAELVRELTVQLPIRVIARMLGIPSEDYARFARLSLDMISLAVDPFRGMTASRELGAYFTEIVAERRRQPRADLISELASLEVEGRALPEEEILGFLRLLLPAGAETTFRLLGNLLFALLSDAQQLGIVLADRSLVAPAIEEALRWETPVQIVSRTPTRDVSIAGMDLPAGAQLNLLLGSANRDESKYENPDRFDLRRQGPPHLAFGGGHHYCLGAHLGRTETIVAMNVLLDRVTDLRMDPDAEAPHVHGQAFRSPTALPVVFSAV